MYTEKRRWVFRVILCQKPDVVPFAVIKYRVDLTERFVAECVKKPEISAAIRRKSISVRLIYGFGIVTERMQERIAFDRAGFEFKTEP